MLRRPRRLRVNKAIRNLVQEHSLSANDFLVPLFIVEGKSIKSEIESMPDYFRFSLDKLKAELDELADLGLFHVLLFAKVEENLKDNAGAEALNPEGLMQKSIRFIKNYNPNFIIFTDVALDPFSEFGHDGIISNGKIINDKSASVLAQMAVSHAQAGADFVAPSDMMDGRIESIRIALDKHNFTDVGILSYSAKYASSFYGPFRDALDSAPVDNKEIPKDKKTYQMDFHNSKEALVECQLDLEEGADIIMVKPGMPYLDILKMMAQNFDIPIAVYQVSGEYAMIKAAAKQGWLNEDEVVYESLMAFKRAGATIIASYFAKDVVKKLT